MRLSILLLICFFCQIAFGQSPILKSIDGNNLYSISADSNKKLIIYLHGGVSDPYLDQESDKIELGYLLEQNEEFLSHSKLNGFDVIVPIANDSLNWLERPKQGFSILSEMVSQLEGQYNEMYICGFSDGGTGSFKMFYQNPHYFDGLVVFNGYPQHRNFYKEVDYKMITDKKVVFMGTFNDKVIPHEFLLTEYCAQKKYNSNTFIYLTSGGHGFANYTEPDFKELFDILSGKNQNFETEPIQGFIRNDTLLELYPYRKAIVRKFGFGNDVYDENCKQQKIYKK